MSRHMFSLDYIQANPHLFLGISIAIIGIITGYSFGKFVYRSLSTIGIEETMEGTDFERSLNKFNLTTVSLFSHLSSWFIYILSLFLAANFAGYLNQTLFWDTAITFLPQIFTAVVALLIGVVLADKTALLIQDRLQQFKLPRLVVLPNIAKYTVIYVALLVALGQIGIETTALVVLLVVYVFGLILFGAIATRRLLSAGMAGLYILLVQPYSIGDTVRIDDYEGIVQEIEVLFTYLEDDSGTEHIIPNHKVFDYGIHRKQN